METTRPPGFPGNPPARMPRAPTPARSPPPRPLRRGEMTFRPTHDVGPRTQCISGLNHAAYGLPVNASRPGSPQAHASLGSRLAADLGRMGLDTHRVSNKVSKITSRHLVPLDRAFPAHALLHESSRARTMLTDRILTCRFMQQRRGGMARRVPAVGVALGWGGSVLPRDPRRGILGGTLGGRCPATAAPRPLAARGESPAAFDRRCIPSACVAPRSNTAAIFPRRALPDERITGLGATLDFHHGLLAVIRCREARASLRGGASHEAEGRRGARGGSAGRVGPPTGWYRQRLLRQILRRRGTCSPA